MKFKASEWGQTGDLNGRPMVVAAGLNMIQTARFTREHSWDLQRMATTQRKAFNEQQSGLAWMVSGVRGQKWEVETGWTPRQGKSSSSNNGYDSRMLNPFIR